MATTTIRGNGFTIVHEDLPPRILVKTLDGKIRGYIDVRSGQEIAATKEQLLALGVSPQALEDVKA